MAARKKKHKKKVCAEPKDWTCTYRIDCVHHSASAGVRHEFSKLDDDDPVHDGSETLTVAGHACEEREIEGRATAIIYRDDDEDCVKRDFKQYEDRDPDRLWEQPEPRMQMRKGVSEFVYEPPKGLRSMTRFKGNDCEIVVWLPERLFRPLFRVACLYPTVQIFFSFSVILHGKRWSLWHLHISTDQDE